MHLGWTPVNGLLPALLPFSIMARHNVVLPQVYSECPSYDELIPALLAHPLVELPERVHFKTGVPIKPMLAKPTTGERCADVFLNFDSAGRAAARRGSCGSAGGRGWMVHGG
jgi:hypothetical protein